MLRHPDHVPPKLRNPLPAVRLSRVVAVPDQHGDVSAHAKPRHHRKRSSEFQEAGDMIAVTAVDAMQPLPSTIQPKPLPSIPGEGGFKPAGRTNAQVIVTPPEMLVIRGDRAQKNRLGVKTQVQVGSSPH